jgi:hypothetical protein
MSADYKSKAQNALRMINEKGRLIRIVVAGGDEVYDPNTDTFTPGTPDESQVKGVFTQFAVKDVDGELILRTDKKVLIAAAALDAAPTPADQLIDGAVSYKVINTETVQPGDTALLYMVQVRR